MKIYYDKKTDFLEFFLENTDYYEDESESISYYIYKSEKDDSNIGYGILNAKANLPSFNKVPPHLKVALYSWVTRKKNNLSQEEFGKLINVSKSTVQRVEEAISEKPTIDYLSGLKSIDPALDLNSLFTRNISESA
jgi:DNA-binding XRE family transcriptional regulator